MAVDDEIAQLRRRQHEMAGDLQKHEVIHALDKQRAETVTAELAHLRETSVTDEELTAALGPIRGRQDLQEQELRTVKQELGKTATSEQLTSAVALIRGDCVRQNTDIAGIQDSLRWVTRIVIGGVVTAVLALLYQVAK